MKVSIRKEFPTDHFAVSDIIKKAFKNEKFSNHQEHLLVKRLRNSNAFIPELSLVAEIDNNIVGHILLSKVKIQNGTEEFATLALAPVSVHPKYQRNGIGEMLIKTSHKIAVDLGYNSIVLLGHENYYPKFGYEQADKFNIELPFDAPKENCMVLELTEGGLKGVNGKVVYPKEFLG